MKYLQKINAVLLGLGISSSVVPVALADDTEIYTESAAAANASNPNIMFIVDTSGSMGSSSATMVKPFYDPNETYTANKTGTTSCISTAVYFTEDGLAPDCSQPLTNYFNYSALECDHAIVGYEADNQLNNAGNLVPYGGKLNPGQDGALLLVGTYSDQLAQYDDDASPPRWRELSIGTSSDRDFAIECFSDNGNSTANGNNNEFIIDNGGDGYTGTAPADLKNPHPVWTGGSANLQLFSGNYINYKNWDPATGDLVSKTRLEQVQHAVDTMVRGNTRVDIGLMRFDSRSGSNGGAIVYPILDVGEDRNDFFTRLANLDADSWTPISEVYYEALLYFGGRSADFSTLSNPGNQVVSKTMMSGNSVFRSPITGTCDKNYIVMLSDGIPKKDDLNATRQGVLPGFPVGSCSTDITSSTGDDNRDSATAPGFASTVDNCFDELALWANTHDVLQVANPANPGADVGVQTVTTHTIGFQIDPNAEALMKSAAVNGGGEANFASSADELVAIFDKLIAQALDVNTTFSSPAVSVNAFNRSTHLDDLYFTLFRPEYTKHWPGNLKKYKLKFYVDVNDDDNDGDITERLPFISGSDNLDAVDASTGFFSDTGKSFWSATTDGSDVRLGGAVSVFNTSRNVYTYTGAYTDTNSSGVKTPVAGVLTVGANAVAVSNAALDDALLGTASLSDKVTGTPYRETLINWAKGLDALSDFGATDTFDDVRPEMGDPLHSEPALVQYGGTATVPDLVIYTGTNDGYLHAFSSITGAEYFSFIPQELLPNLKTLMENPDGDKIYGLDGSVAAWVTDANNDNDIEASDGDSAIIYFSMRRGGKNIYAMDVTDRTAPKLLWVIKGGQGDYAELGDTWSTVNVRKIKDGNTEKTVLIFGGGYDESQDTALVRTPDSEGRAVFIADATTGERLWIGADGGDTDIDEMDYSIPARIQPLDITGDGYIDRLYVADMGGQLFRFDIDNTNGSALSGSITGARIADLAGSAAIDARRFYYPPDVALVTDESGKYDAIVIGSGYRAHPLNTTIHDRIYMVKDKQTGFTTSYTTDVDESDLKDVTLNIAGGDGADVAARDAELLLIQGKEGWFISLDDETNSGTWLGEKVLAEPLLIEGVAVLTTYTPNIVPAVNACGPPLGVGKVYFLDILDATPAFPANTDLRPQRHTGTTLAQPGIPSTPHLIVPKDEQPCLAIGANCSAVDFGLGVRKTYWYEEEK